LVLLETLDFPVQFLLFLEVPVELLCDYSNFPLVAEPDLLPPPLLLFDLFLIALHQPLFPFLVRQVTGPHLWPLEVPGLVGGRLEGLTVEVGGGRGSAGETFEFGLGEGGADGVEGGSLEPRAAACVLEVGWDRLGEGHSWRW
jgi:hypothetical protein